MHDQFRIELLQIPPLTETVFSLLDQSGATHYALFGGAVRDMDYNAHYQQNLVIKDYDVRIWLPFGDDAKNVAEFIETIEDLSGLKAEASPGPGSNRPRYILTLAGYEIDLSFAQAKDDLCHQPLNAVALDRIQRSSAGISAVAIDAERHAWALPEYRQDIENMTLSIYPDKDKAKQTNYANRMQKKFPDHKLVYI